MQAALKINLKSKRLLMVLVGCAFLLLALAFYFYLPLGHEWSHTFRPAALRLIQGISPYNDQGYLGYYNPPWLLLPIIPFALLPEQLGYAFFTLVGLLAFTFIAYRCKVKSWFVIPILLSYPVTFCLYRGQVDWLVLLGITLPPQFGLLLVLAKPQIGIGIAVYWLISAFRTGGLKRLFITISPTLAAYLISVLLFGLWFIPPAGIENSVINASLWPESIPIGLALLVYALRKFDLNFSMLASPFFSPYLSAYSWSGALLALSQYPFELVAVSIGTWIWRFVQIIQS